MVQKDDKQNGTLSTCTASFRGRKLRGAEIPLPPGYVGLVLQTDGRSPTLSYRASRRFDKVTYWNHDVVPSRADDIQAQFDWIAMASVLHEEPLP